MTCSNAAGGGTRTLVRRSEAELGNPKVWGAGARALPAIRTFFPGEGDVGRLEAR